MSKESTLRPFAEIVGEARLAQAEAYFKAKGIDPSVKPEEDTVNHDIASTIQDHWQFHHNITKLGMTTCPCMIDILAVLFYSHVTVTFTDPSGKSHTYEGDAGGVGAGEITGPGVIYYSDLATLLGTKSFGVSFVSADGGTAMVTWGSHGNANIIGIGDGLGAFGGSGSWK